MQVRILTIADRHAGHGAAVRDRIAGEGFRVELDDRQEKIGLKIREAQLQKIPYMLVVGDREVDKGTVAVRNRTAGDQGASTVNDLVLALHAEVRAKRSPEAERTG